MASRLRSLWQQIQQHRLLTLVIIVVLIAFIAFTMAVWRFGWDWTGFTGGFSQITTTSTNYGTTTTTVKPPGKTLWDLLQLLIVPIVLAIVAFLFNLATTRNAQKTTQLRDRTDRAIAVDNQRETALQAYLDKMSELLFERHLRESQPEDEVRTIARARTLTVLPRLDTNRKGSLIQFLYEARLIKTSIGSSIIKLKGTDLSGAKLVRANLSQADLSGADLREAVLDWANLSGANLSKTNLSRATLIVINLTGADLSGANLYESNLSEAYLNNADLSVANLENADLKGANLSQADLSGADLREANLSKADLSEANLSRASVTLDQLNRAKSLQGATMPDGSKHS